MLKRILVIIERRFLSIEPDRSAVFCVNAGQNLHQRAFTGAVASDQGIHLPGKHFKFHILQHSDAEKAF